MRFTPSSATPAGRRSALPPDRFRPGVCRSEVRRELFGSSPCVACSVRVEVFDYGENGQSGNRERWTCLDPPCVSNGVEVDERPLRMERRSDAISRWSLLRGSRQSRATSCRARAPQHKLDAVIAEDASFVPGRQIRGELEAEDEQLAKEVSLVGEDGHDDVFNVRKRTKDVGRGLERNAPRGRIERDRRRSRALGSESWDCSRPPSPPSRVTSRRSRRQETRADIHRGRGVSAAGDRCAPV